MALRAGLYVLFLAFLSLYSLLFAARCFAETTYYVDSVAGSDTNSGTFVMAPWRTVAKVNSTRFAPGDHILFKRGSRWRELLSPDSSGEAGNPIVIDAYGTGAAPILTGTNLVAPGSWALCSACQINVWRAEVSTPPNIVMFDGARGNEKASIAALSSPGDWYWTSDILYVWCTLNPGSHYLNPGVEAGNRAVVVNLSALAYLTLQNLNLTGANGLPTNGIIYAHTQDGVPPRSLVLNNLTLGNGAGQGIHLEDCTNCVIQGSDISGMGNDGICLVTLHTAYPVTSGSIIGNTVSTSQHNGIATYGCAVGAECQGLTFPNGIFLSGIEISANTIHDNGEGIYLEWTNHSSITSNNVYHNTETANSNAEGGGIELESSSNNMIQKNLVYSNRGNGIELSNDSGTGSVPTGSSYNVVGYNAVHDNGGHGLFTDAAPTQSNLFKYNLVWNQIAGECFLANGIGHGFYGNVCWNNSTGVDLYTSSTTPLTGHISIKNNIIANSIKRAVHIESGVSVSTLVFDHNNYDFGSGEEFLLFNSVYNLSEWRAATRFDTHSFSANPQFVASTPASPGDFVLQSISPNLGTGTTLGSSLDLGLAPAAAWPSGVTTAAQPSAWNIGAFVVP